MRRAALRVGVIAAALVGVLVVFVVFVVLVGPVAAGQAAKPSPSASEKLPPLSYVCIMPGDEDVIEDKAGKCRKCGMDLHPVRLATVWTCLNNTAIQRDAPGKCPSDGRDLVPMTMSVTWTCPGAPALQAAQGATSAALEPGTCPDGSVRTKTFTARAHGNHNPQHGGSFFMAPDAWHHLEGAYFSTGVFRLYFYDDFTRPLAIKQLLATDARLVNARDGKAYPLARNGRFLEAKVGKLPLPASFQAKVKFKAGDKDNLFDFAFEKFSLDAPVIAAPTTTNAAATPSAAGATPDAPPLLELGVDPALVPVPVAETVPEMLEQLRTRSEQIRAFIERGSFASVYVPAFQAKDVALALDAKKGDLSEDRQKIVAPAVNRLVRSAYLLDAFGDLGNKQQIVEAYARFTAAIKDIESAFPQKP